ncbi:MAG: hypothetical protein ACW99U_21700 [Candidatus Thorarchaeota archaeon]|jgi:hypothetical protein
MMNPFRKIIQNWKGTKGEEPTPSIVTESRRRYTVLIFILVADIPIVVSFSAYQPIEGLDWFWYPILTWIMWSHGYYPYRIIKDLLEKKTRTLVEGPLDRVNMADPEVKGTIDIGVDHFKKIDTDNPASFMYKGEIHQRGGIEELALKGDPEDGGVISPRGSMLNFGHTRVLNAYPHRYLVGDLPEPIRSQLKNKLPYKDHHFIDLAFEQMYITIQPEQTGEVIETMEQTWLQLTAIYDHIKDNDGKENGLLEVIDSARDNMYLLRDIFHNVDAGKPKFDAHHLIKEQSNEIKKWKADRDDLFEQLRNMRQGPEQPPPPGGQD